MSEVRGFGIVLATVSIFAAFHGCAELHFNRREMEKDSQFRATMRERESQENEKRRQFERSEHARQLQFEAELRALTSR